jgi:hypothetical protein
MEVTADKTVVSTKPTKRDSQKYGKKAKMPSSNKSPGNTGKGTPDNILLGRFSSEHRIYVALREKFLHHLKELFGEEANIASFDRVIFLIVTKKLDKSLFDPSLELLAKEREAVKVAEQKRNLKSDSFKSVVSKLTTNDVVSFLNLFRGEKDETGGEKPPKDPKG